MQDELRRCLDTHARLLYGLIHARWILTVGGLEKMVRTCILALPSSIHHHFFQVAKYMCCDFGRCPRVFCHSHPLLPVGLVDVPFEKSVKLYCGRCEDIYTPRASRHSSIDGAHFGTTFPHLFYLVYPSLMPLPACSPADTPKRVGTLDARHPGSEMLAGHGIITASAVLQMESYCPRIYGFKLNETARLRWQEETQSEIRSCISKAALMSRRWRGWRSF